MVHHFVWSHGGARVGLFLPLPVGRATCAHCARPGHRGRSQWWQDRFGGFLWSTTEIQLSEGEAPVRRDSSDSGAKVMALATTVGSSEQKSVELQPQSGCELLNSGVSSTSEQATSLLAVAIEPRCRRLRRLPALLARKIQAIVKALGMA